MKKDFKCIQRKDFLQIAPKNLVPGNHMMHIWKEHAQTLLTSPTIDTPVTHPLGIPTQLLKQPMGTWMKLLKNNLPGVPFTYFKYRIALKFRGT